MPHKRDGVGCAYEKFSTWRLTNGPAVAAAQQAAAQQAAAAVAAAAEAEAGAAAEAEVEAAAAKAAAAKAEKAAAEKAAGSCAEAAAQKTAASEKAAEAAKSATSRARAAAAKLEQVGAFLPRGGRVRVRPERGDFVDPTTPGLSFANPKGGLKRGGTLADDAAGILGFRVQEALLAVGAAGLRAEGGKKPGADIGKCIRGKCAGGACVRPARHPGHCKSADSAGGHSKGKFPVSQAAGRKR